MREKNKEDVQETTRAFTFAILLLKFLILAAILGLIWFIQFLVSQNGPFNAILRDVFWKIS